MPSTDPDVIHAFFKDLPEKYHAMLAAAAKAFAAAPGELLAREGRPAETFYLIQSGHVSIELDCPGRPLAPIQTVGPDEAVGWSWIVPPYRWEFDARAIDAVTGIRFDADWLREQCEQDTRLGYVLLRKLVNIVAARLTATRLQLLDLYR